MEQRGWMVGLNRIFIWFSNLAYLNFLWILFSLIGLVFLGVGPATSALFAVIRRLLSSDEKLPLTKTFYQYFRNDFGKVNGVFYLMLLIGVILYVDIYFLYQMNGTISSVFMFLLIIITIFYLITFIYLFPVYVHFELSVIGYIKQAFIIAVIKPAYLLLMVISLLASYLIFYIVPVLLLFFSISLGAFIMMHTCRHVFSQIDVMK